MNGRGSSAVEPLPPFFRQGDELRRLTKRGSAGLFDELEDAGREARRFVEMRAMPEASRFFDERLRRQVLSEVG